jgi:predicted nuclease with RNAse H fold
LSVAGIDLGATHVHVALLDGDDVTVHSTTEIDSVVEWCAGVTAVAVDAPSEPATGRVHDGDHSPKFAIARCNEIAAGEQLGVWVPWVTPTLDEAPAWMRTGFAVWAALRRAGHEPVEVYPAGSFWLLNGRRWPPRKSSPAGRAARLALLARYVGPLGLTSHDHIDAVMAAVVARGPHRLVGHDGPGCDTSRLAVLA